MRPIFLDSKSPAQSSLQIPDINYFSCQAGKLDSCKNELTRLKTAIDDETPGKAFSVEQFKGIGIRFLEVQQALQHHCREGRAEFCLEMLDDGLPDFENFRRRDMQERLVVSLVAAHLRAACDADDLAACEKLSEQYKLISEKAALPERLEKIAHLFEARCRAGHLAACVELQERRLWKGLATDPVRAEKFLEETALSARIPCERGQTGACHDEMLADYFLGAGRPELPLHPGRAADAVLGQFESGKFCDGLSQTDCMIALLQGQLMLGDPALSWKRFDRLITGLPGFLKTGCEAGNGKACMVLAMISKEPLPDLDKNPDPKMAPAKNLLLYLDNAWHLKADPAAAAALLGRAVDMLTKDCTRGDLAACGVAMQAREAALEGEKPSEEQLKTGQATVEAAGKQAIESNRAACMGGDAPACARNAESELNKQHDPVNPETLGLLESACRGAESGACLHLALLAIEGNRPTEAEIATAAALFRSACDAKVGIGCRNYLTLRRSGVIKLEPDAPKTAQLLEQGCSYADLESCYMLGIRLLRGKDEPARGLQLLQTNCDKNEVQSCEYLGGVYEYGLSSVPKDRAAARRYYQRACDLGNQRACDSVKDLDKSPEPDDSPAPDVGLPPTT